MAETQTPEIGSLTLPDTEPFRVKGVGASYQEATETIGPDGKPTVVYVTRLAGAREIVHLVAGEARRLRELGAVVPASDPPTYDELPDDRLAILAQQRGVRVRSTSADPDKPLREDLINALHTHDLGADSELVKGVGTTPGGVIVPTEGQTPTTLVDGVNPNVGTEQDDEVDTSPLDEAAGRIGLTSQQAADQETGRSGSGAVYDARGKSSSELSDWISSEKPNASRTIAAAHDDPETAATLREAEQAAHGGDGRATVVEGLGKIADRE